MSASEGPERPVVLLIEDDQELRESLGAALGHRYRVDAVADATQALARWEAGRPDLVVVDLGLPDLDGMTLIRRMRREASTPLLVLTARDRERDKVDALEQGADDYVTKPFGMAELDARLGALLRRSLGGGAGPDGALQVGTLTVDVARHQVRVGDVPVQLTPREFELLKVLASRAGRIVTHGHLLRAVWGTAYADEQHYLHVHVSALRRKLRTAEATAREGVLIVSEPGVGYRLAPAQER